MTSREIVQRSVAGACGVGGAVSFAIGVVLVVLWTLDSASSSASLPELIVGVAAIGLGYGCVVARRRLTSANQPAPLT